MQMSQCLALMWVVACASARTAPGKLTEVAEYSSQRADITRDSVELLDRHVRSPSFHDLELERIARRRKTSQRSGRRIGKVVIKHKNGRRVVVKKRRKPTSRNSRPVAEKITTSDQFQQTSPSDIFAQNDNSFIPTQNIISESELKFKPKKQPPIPAPTRPPPPPPTPPIPHLKHTLSPEENFPAIIVTPRSTQGIISSKEIIERNKNREVDTLADLQSERSKELESQALLVEREEGRSRQDAVRQNKVFTNFVQRQEIPVTVQNLEKSFESEIQNSEPIIDLVKQRNEERFQRLLEKAESAEAQERFQTKFKQQNQLERFPSRQTSFQPVRQQRLEMRQREEGVRLAVENEGINETFQEQISFSKFPEPEERFAQISATDRPSAFLSNIQTQQIGGIDRPRALLSNIRTATSSDLMTESPMRSQIRQEQNFIQLEEPRSSNELFQQRFDPTSLFDNFPSFSSITPNNNERLNPRQFLDFGPFTSNINMQDGSYTITTVFS